MNVGKKDQDHNPSSHQLRVVELLQQLYLQMPKWQSKEDFFS
jgi:hypothetical protein